jgi:hypothetical protein
MVNVMTQEAGFLTRGTIFALTALMCLWGVQAMAADGLTTIRRANGPKETMNRLEAEVKAKGLTVFARIDHAAGAAAVGLSLRTDLPRSITCHSANRRTKDPRTFADPAVPINERKVFRCAVSSLLDAQPEGRRPAIASMVSW